MMPGNTGYSEAAADNEVLLPGTMHRIMCDISEFAKVSPSDIFVVPDPENVLTVHVIIVGPVNTPYEKGFFYFVFTFPGNYPLSPPKVTLINTDQNRVRFSPNLYANGLVCLSILGTFSGPSWSPIQTLYTVSISIQSLMNENPFYNEPGTPIFLDSDIETSKSKRYNDAIRYQTIRVAVINMMKEDNMDTRHMPTALREKIAEIFKQNVSYYNKTISENLVLDGTMIFDFYNYCRETAFDYQLLKTKMDELTMKFGAVSDDAAGNSNLLETDNCTGVPNDREEEEQSDLSEFSDAE